MRVLRLTAAFCMEFAVVRLGVGLPLAGLRVGNGYRDRNQLLRPFHAARVTPRVVPGKIVAVCVVDHGSDQLSRIDLCQGRPRAIRMLHFQ